MNKHLKIYWMFIILLLCISLNLYSQVNIQNSSRILSNFQSIDKSYFQDLWAGHDSLLQILNASQCTDASAAINGLEYMACAVDPGQNYFLVGYIESIVYLLTGNVEDHAWAVMYGLETGHEQFNSPQGIDIDQNYNIYICDTGNNRLVKMHCDVSGNISYQWSAGGLNGPIGVSVTGSTVLVADCNNNRIVKYNSSGSVVETIGSVGSGEWQFNHPEGGYVIGSDELLVADTGNDRIVYINGSQWETCDFPSGANLTDVAYHDEIYAIDDGLDYVHKIKKPNLYLASKSYGNLVSIDKAAGTITLVQSSPWEFSQNTVGYDVVNLQSDSPSSTEINYSYILTTAASVTDLIKDSGDNIIRTLRDNVSLETSPNVTGIWDLTDDYGSPVDTGLYTLEVSTGSISRSLSVQVTDYELQPPTNLNASLNGDTQIDLSWTDNSDDEDGFKIERKVGTGSYELLDTVGPDVENYSDTGLSPGTTYTYLVCAYKGSENSGYSNEASETTPSPSQSPYGGTPWAIPGTIQAENFDEGGEGFAYHDMEANNYGGKYRTGEGVDIENTGDTGGGYDVGWIKSGEWMEYTVNISSSENYKIDLRVATPYSTGKFHIAFDGVDKTGQVSVPNTGGWQSWTTVSLSNVSLNSGQHVMRIAIDGNDFNLNKLSFSKQSPYGGTPWAIPGTIEAENFDEGGEGLAYHDMEANNYGGKYRTSEGVDIENTGDTGGGYDVGWIKSGEWMEYTVNVSSSGSYRIDLRVATSYTTGKLHIAFDGIDKTGQISVPNTGGWQNWTTLSVNDVSLNSGQHVMRIAIDGNDFNLNKLSFSASGGGTEPDVPSNLNVSAVSCSQINLSWTDNSDNENGFKIERKEGSGSFTQIGTVGAGITGYNNTGLSASTMYTYRVCAYNNDGDSDYSNEDSETTPSCGGAPISANNLTATAVSSSQSNLTWNDRSDNEDGFKIERKVSGGSFGHIATLGENVTNYTNTGLSASTVYIYRVCAFNDYGNSAYSNEAFDTTWSGIPNPPSNLTTTSVGAYEVLLGWTDNSNNETGFKMYRGIGKKPINPMEYLGTVGSNHAYYVDYTVQPSTLYRYQVCATNGFGDSDFSNLVLVTTDSSGGAPQIMNIPNPFNPETIIEYRLNEPGTVVIKIFDMLGKELITLENSEKMPGKYSVVWDGKNRRGLDVSSGTYFYQFRFKDKVITRKMLLMR